MTLKIKCLACGIVLDDARYCAPHVYEHMEIEAMVRDAGYGDEVKSDFPIIFLPFETE